MEFAFEVLTFDEEAVRKLSEGIDNVDITGTVGTTTYMSIKSNPVTVLSFT